MFNFSFKKSISLKDAGFFEGFTDCHSHILPCVDDGVSSESDSNYILDEYEKLGVRHVVFTPHIMEDMFICNEEFLRERFDEFMSQYKGTIEISLAAEYMIDSSFKNHLLSSNMLTLYDNYLLVETSTREPALRFTANLERIMSSGYFVVLAHPERYCYMDKREYMMLKDMGVFFQLNITSLLGYYGSSSLCNAEYLLSQGMYDFIGSDIHNRRLFDNEMFHSRLKYKIIDKLLNLKEKNNKIISR
ncbi:MAG: CpsB/CapC family capsule biosynthesis tyrosine phosphatase [Rikenellaceae bacterium]